MPPLRRSRRRARAASAAAGTGDGTAPLGVAAGAAPVPDRGLRRAVSAFRHRNFAVFWTGALLSNIGTWMQALTIPFVLYDLTGSASVVGIGGFLQFFPIVLMGPIAGSVADRFPRRQVLLLTQSAAAVGAAALWITWELGVRSPAAIIALVALNSVVVGVNIPSWQAFISELVPRAELLNAVTLNSAQFNASRAVGPAIGGLVLGAWGPGAAFLLNAVSFVAVIVALRLVRVPALERARPDRRVLGQFAEGLAAVRRDPAILVCIVLVVLVALLGMPVLQLMAVFAEDVFRISEGSYGVLAGMLGFGSVLATPLVAGWGSSIPRGRLVGAALVVYGGALAAFAQSPSYGVALVFAAVAGAGFLTIVSSLNTTVQLLVTETLRGRVTAIYVMSFTGAYPVGALVQGWLTDRWGAPATVTGAGLLIAATAVVLLCSGEILSRIDRSEGDGDGVDRRPGSMSGPGTEPVGVVGPLSR